MTGATVVQGAAIKDPRWIFTPLIALFALGFLPTLSEFALAQPLDEVAGLADRGFDPAPRETLNTEPIDLGVDEAEVELPTRLDAWSAPVAELTSDELLPISPALLPQSIKGSPTPFIDFRHFEWGAFAGLVDYSSNFKGSVSWALGVDARVPIPGLPLGRWGVFAEIYMADLDRNLPFFYPRPKGTWYGGAAGADFTLIKGEIAYFRLQGGVDYSFFNRINGVDNGMGGMVGAQLGFFWIKQNNKTSVTLTPQIFFNGTDYFILATFGFSIEF